MLGVIQQLRGPNVGQCWPPIPLYWTVMDILHNCYLPFVHITKHGLSTDHPPTSSCLHNYWMPLTIILIYLFNQVPTKTNKQTNLDSQINSIILSFAFHFFIYALLSSFYISNTQCTQIICHFLHSSGLLFLFQLLPNFPIVFLCFFHFWLHFLKSERKTNNSFMIEIKTVSQNSTFWQFFSK